MAKTEKSEATKTTGGTPPTQKSGNANPSSTIAFFPVVGIGASAGGLEALDEILDHMPSDSGLSFVIVTHQHPGHTSLLPELLGKHTEMPVSEVIDGVHLKPNCVYVSPPSSNLALLNGALHTMPLAAKKLMFPRLPIDYFFHSLAADRKHRAICIVLSGTGTDGTLGLKAIKAESGMAMVQKPETASYAGMPSSALATGLVDYALPVDELETSNEELKSTNEELTTVNSELHSKVEDLSQINDDMQNLLYSTEIATIFLDPDLNINRFTEQAKSLISLRPADIGRPIEELTTHLRNHDLQRYCRQVLQTLSAFEIEVRSTEGKWFLMKITPYRTSENVSDGLVITFVDIDQLMAGREALAFSQSIINTVTQPLVILDEDLRVVAANKTYYQRFRTSQQQSAGELICELGSAQWDIPELRYQLSQVLPQKKSFDAFQVTANFPKIGRRSFFLNGRQLERDEGLPGMILLAMEEIDDAG